MGGVTWQQKQQAAAWCNLKEQLTTNCAWGRTRGSQLCWSCRLDVQRWETVVNAGTNWDEACRRDSCVYVGEVAIGRHGKGSRLMELEVTMHAVGYA